MNLIEEHNKKWMFFRDISLIAKEYITNIVLV